MRKSWPAFSPRRYRMMVSSSHTRGVVSDGDGEAVAIHVSLPFLGSRLLC